MENLFDIKVGQKCEISDILINTPLKRRLIDIGLTPKSVVKCVGKSPLGDPKAYLISGAVIALRQEVAKEIRVKIC